MTPHVEQDIQRSLGRIEETLKNLNTRLETLEKLTDRVSSLERAQAWVVGACVATGALVSAAWAVLKR